MTKLVRAVSTVIDKTQTAQLRRLEIPARGRRAQKRQLALAVVLWAGLSAYVYFLGAPLVWHLVVFLFCLRIASKRILLDCIKIAGEILAMVKDFLPGGRT